MSGLILGMKNEFYKILSRKKYIVLFAIGALICIGRLGGGMLISKISSGIVDIQTNMPLGMMRLMTDILAPLIIFMAVTDLFASEIQEDTLKTAIMAPITRAKVLVSKAAAVFLLCAAYYIGYYLVCLILQIISGNVNASVMTAAFGAYMLDLIPLIAVIGFAVLINMISKSPSLAMLLCIAVYVIFKYMEYYVSPMGQMLFTSYSQWHKLWMGSLLPFRSMAAKVGILSGSVLILYTISYIIFDRKDI